MLATTLNPFTAMVLAHSPTTTWVALALRRTSTAAVTVTALLTTAIRRKLQELFAAMLNYHSL